MSDLFGEIARDAPPGLTVLRGFALENEGVLIRELTHVFKAAPPRHMRTPGGKVMYAAMTNCGPLGWVSDTRGYRYEPCDPEGGKPWPAMPRAFADLAAEAAMAGGFPGFSPDACLINRYEPGAKMGLHQDRDESDFGAPIVSLSLGLPMTFQFGGGKRSDPVYKIPLEHGDVVVWGGEARLNYHGVMTLKDGEHPLLGRARINLTFRKAR